MAEETWQDIPGLPGYQLSSELRVRSFYKRGPKGGINLDGKPRVLKGYLGDYPSFKMFKDGKQQNVLLHQIVAAVFLGPTPEGMEIRHFDDDRTNNHPSNLRFGTPKQNREDAVRNGKMSRGGRHHNAKLGEDDDARGIRILAEAGMIQKEIAELFGISQAHASKIINGVSWSHVG